MTKDIQIATETITTDTKNVEYHWGLQRDYQRDRINLYHHMYVNINGTEEFFYLSNDGRWIKHEQGEVTEPVLSFPVYILHQMDLENRMEWGKAEEFILSKLKLWLDLLGAAESG